MDSISACYMRDEFSHVDCGPPIDGIADGLWRAPGFVSRRSAASAGILPKLGPFALLCERALFYCAAIAWRS
jgi:hypothetical protein